jgi:hypothetical protein
VSASGVYLSIKDLIDIGKNLNIPLAFKKRSLVLQKLITQAKEEDKSNELITELCTLINHRANTYKTFLSSYDNAHHLIAQWIKKTEASKMLIQRELYKGNSYDG